jgi:hypothetical protein
MQLRADRYSVRTAARTCGHVQASALEPAGQAAVPGRTGRPSAAFWLNQSISVGLSAERVPAVNSENISQAP